LVTSAKKIYENLQQYEINESEPLLFEEFIEGIPININAVVFPHYTKVYPASVQLIGLPDCTSLPFGYCGNDFVAAHNIPALQLRECYRQTESIAERLRQSGYKGIFGIDMIFTPEGKVYPCEINPRFQHSTSLLNLGFYSNNDSPVSMHMASLANIAPRECNIDIDCDLSQIIVQALDSETDFLVGGKLVEGIYDINSLTLVNIPTAPVLELKPNQIMLCGSPPCTGTRVKAGATLFKIISKNQVTKDGFSLTSDLLKNAIAFFKQQLNLLPQHKYA
jgi:hypothetical protein